MSGISAIIKKEIDRVIGDRKLIFSLFILPIVLVIGIMYLTSTLLGNMHDDINKHTSSIYVQNAPANFVEFVEAANVNVELKTLEEADLAEKKEGVVQGDVDLIYVFDPEFESKITNYKQGDAIPTVEVYYNDSEDYSSNANEIMTMVLNQYQQQLLVQRFGSAEAVQIFHVSANELVDQAKATNQAIGRLAPYLISILMFASAMGLVVDAMVGEKERGTLASMLITPVSRKNIALGKLIALAILSTCSAAIYAISMMASFPLMIKGMSDEAVSFNVNFSGIQIAQMLVIMILVTLLYVSVIALVSILAKNTKQATSYVSPMYMLVMVIGMATMYSVKGDVASYLYAVPFYGNAIAIQKILTSGLSAVEFLFAAGGLLVTIVVLVSLLTRAFNNEKVMFNA